MEHRNVISTLQTIYPLNKIDTFEFEIDIDFISVGFSFLFVGRGTCRLVSFEEGMVASNHNSGRNNTL